MSGWPSVALDDIFDIARGGSPRPIDAYLTDDPNGVNWIMIGDASESSKYISRTRKRIRPERVKRSRTVKPGDFLLTNSMSFGRPYITATHGCVHDGWLVLSAKRPDVDPDFLYHLLGSQPMYAEFERRAAGVTVKNLNIDLVKGVQIRLPPISEQRRIAGILDRADALRAKRRAALAQVASLTQATFLTMFGDPIDNPRQWPVRRLAELIDTRRPISYGILMPGPDVPDGVKYVRVVDMQDGTIALASIRRTTTQISNEYKRSLLKAGDLLMSIRGHVGRLATVPATLDEANITQDSARLAIVGANPAYVRECLRSSSFQRWMARHTKGVAVKGINLGDVKLMPIPLPPESEQATFARTSARISHTLDDQYVHQRCLNALFSSLQDRAFCGEL